MKTRHVPLLFSFVCAISGLSLNKPSLPLSTETVTQFGNPTWIENIAVRSNGDLLITELLPKPILYAVIDPASSAPEVRLLHDFSAEEVPVEGLTGIAEISHDVFVLVGGSAATLSFYAWSVNFTSTHRPLVRKVADLKHVKLPNGVATLPGSSSSVLIADSLGGLAWHLDIRTGKSVVAVQAPEMAFPPNETDPSRRVGINGIKVHKGLLYFSNSNSRSIYKVKIGKHGICDPSAGVRLVGRLPDGVSFLDDFAVRDGGRRPTIFATTSSDNRLWALALGKRPVVVAGEQDKLTLAGVTAAAFGRGLRDKDVLYAVTSGGVGKPVNGSLTEGGKVAKIDLSAFWL
ncbi:hypothetical protein QBC40DRAFT_298222 [Triangularia verruculosa]|uniref:Uncharacterized protein n=1 Tax=Triangularia verruculosa TaxID=2587418 RepID=A0AAN7AU35_9PEZI|nr:hypothetical protein QBC40DRAFT_298222 [Triangularia verruculosa]